MKKAENYEICLSIDLRCFNNSKMDLGVSDYVKTLGFIPHRLFFHETYMDQIHTHDGTIDDTFLEPQWISQRAMPGAQMWTKRQYKSLIDELHNYDIKFYQGAEAAWSCWPEYGEINRCTYLYEQLPEIFIVGRNGKNAKDGAMGAINPLRRFKDGTMYEDKIIEDTKRFLIDYECDGFFAADGFAGLAVPLRDGCYANDMIEQFTEYTGIEIPNGDTPQRAKILWEKYRYEWTVFYSDRWASFHSKLSKALEGIGKDLTTFTPWQKGPADSLVDFGFDYGKSYRAGVKEMTLEMMEEVTSRRFQNSAGWEAVCIANAVTAKAQADGLKLLWTASTCNCPEHWHTMRDQPVIIEREALALGASGTINEKGELIPAVDGVLTIFGIDLWNSEWMWLKRRLDEGFSYKPNNILGLTIVWSDKILYEHLKRGVRWSISSAVSRLRYAGIPISQGINLSNINKLSDSTTMLLINPIGLEDSDVDNILKEVTDGRNLVVVGNVENKKLSKALGVSQGINKPQKDTIIFGNFPDNLSGYKATVASVVATTEEGSLLLARNKYGKGETLFIRRLIDSMPPLKMSRTSEEARSYPKLVEEDKTIAYEASSIREQLENLISIHPDKLDLAAAKAIQDIEPLIPAPGSGQILAFETNDGDHVMLVENSANLMYASINVQLPMDKKVIMEFPEIKPLGPVGYLYFNNKNPRSFEVCVPPDACVPIRVVYKK